jgi:hypothetical protein
MQSVSLPVDVWCQILNLLGVKDRVKMRQVSRDLKRAVDRNASWKTYTDALYRMYPTLQRVFGESGGVFAGLSAIMTDRRILMTYYHNVLKGHNSMYLALMKDIVRAMFVHVKTVALTHVFIASTGVTFQTNSRNLQVQVLIPSGQQCLMFESVRTNPARIFQLHEGCVCEFFQKTLCTDVLTGDFMRTHSLFSAAQTFELFAIARKRRL